MKIDIVCVGKLKEDYLRAAAAEYLKRLTPYARVNIRELPESTIAKEAADICKILETASPQSRKIALAIDGAAVSSQKFAHQLEKFAIDGISHFIFVIGGAEGLDDSVLAACHMRLSLSAMTFTHQMARVLLLEQIYRAHRIINNEPYHK